MKFTYVKAPLHKYTFRSTKIKDWVISHCEGRVLNLFAGETLLGLNEMRNDLNRDIEADYHHDAYDFVRCWDREKFDTIILDPPYSYRKSMEKYNGCVASNFKRVKDYIPSILNNNGIVITFGYHSISMGKGRGFKQEHVLLINHGGAIHDTIATIERKIS